MPGKDRLKVWMDGKLIKYGDARVPILTHSMQYGSGVFEGIRSYKTARGTAVFRLRDHIKRFLNSAKIYSMRLGYAGTAIETAVKMVVGANALGDSYIRPFAFYDDDDIGISTKGKRISVYIAAVPFGAYFGPARETGLRCKVSSWHRINSEILPVEAKASGNYVNSIIAGNEARESGFDEAILTSIDGDVAEGPGENIFIVKDGGLVTPDVDSDILVGITRDSVIKIAESEGIRVEQRSVKRDELYTADELFFTGTAAELTPIVNVDGTRISRGAGPITKALAASYGSVVHGRVPEFGGWLTYV
jgi:branched-chain amino acid aminotransferase